MKSFAVAGGGGGGGGGGGVGGRREEPKADLLASIVEGKEIYFLLTKSLSSVLHS